MRKQKRKVEESIDEKLPKLNEKTKRKTNYLLL